MLTENLILVNMLNSVTIFLHLCMRYEYHSPPRLRELPRRGSKKNVGTRGWRVVLWSAVQFFGYDMAIILMNSSAAVVVCKRLA